MTVPALPATEALARRMSGSPLLLMLDVDGTLAPMAPTPSDARVPDSTRRVAADLVRQPDVYVAVVSGRGALDAARVAGLGPVWVIGNHGMEIEDPAGAHRVDAAAAPYASAVVHAAAALAREIRAMPGVLLENKGITLSVHYRLADRSLVLPVRRLVGRVAGEYSLRVMTGKEVLELRPPVDINKGTAVVRLAKQLGFVPHDSGAGERMEAAPEPCPSMLYAGDDRSDEDAFRLLRLHFPYAVTVLVGDVHDRPTPTQAEFSVRDTDGVRELLEWLRELRTGD